MISHSNAKGFSGFSLLLNTPIQQGDSNFGVKYVALQPNSAQSNIGQQLENANRFCHQADMLKTNFVDNMANAAYASGMLSEAQKKSYDSYSETMQNILHHTTCATGVMTNLTRDIAEKK